MLFTLNPNIDMNSEVQIKIIENFSTSCATTTSKCLHPFQTVTIENSKFFQQLLKLFWIFLFKLLSYHNQFQPLPFLPAFSFFQVFHSLSLTWTKNGFSKAISYLSSSHMGMNAYLLFQKQILCSHLLTILKIWWLATTEDFFYMFCRFLKTFQVTSEVKYVNNFK